MSICKDTPTEPVTISVIHLLIRHNISKIYTVAKQNRVQYTVSYSYYTLSLVDIKIYTCTHPIWQNNKDITIHTCWFTAIVKIRYPSWLQHHPQPPFQKYMVKKRIRMREIHLYIHINIVTKKVVSTAIKQKNKNKLSDPAIELSPQSATVTWKIINQDCQKSKKQLAKFIYIAIQINSVNQTRHLNEFQFHNNILQYTHILIQSSPIVDYIGKK